MQLEINLQPRGTSSLPWVSQLDPYMHTFRRPFPQLGTKYDSNVDCITGPPRGGSRPKCSDVQIVMVLHQFWAVLDHLIRLTSLGRIHRVF